MTEKQPIKKSAMSTLKNTSSIYKIFGPKLPIERISLYLILISVNRVKSQQEFQQAVYSSPWIRLWKENGEMAIPLLDLQDITQVTETQLQDSAFLIMWR